MYWYISLWKPGSQYALKVDCLLGDIRYNIQHKYKLNNFGLVFLMIPLTPVYLSFHACCSALIGPTPSTQISTSRSDSLIGWNLTAIWKLRMCILCVLKFHFWYWIFALHEVRILKLWIYFLKTWNIPPSRPLPSHLTPPIRLSVVALFLPPFELFS